VRAVVPPGIRHACVVHLLLRRANVRRAELVCGALRCGGACAAVRCCSARGLAVLRTDPFPFLPTLLSVESSTTYSSPQHDEQQATQQHANCSLLPRSRTLVAFIGGGGKRSVIVMRSKMTRCSAAGALHELLCHRSLPAVPAAVRAVCCSGALVV